MSEYLKIQTFFFLCRGTYHYYELKLIKCPYLLRFLLDNLYKVCSSTHFCK